MGEDFTTADGKYRSDRALEKKHWDKQEGGSSYTPKNVAMARSAVLRSVSPGCHST